MALRTKWKPGKEEVVVQNGAVTSMQPQSAEAGLAMLKAGGNAVDAAVAMGFCNVVLEPYMATIGGMGYMLVHVASEGKTYAIDFNGRAPRNANPEMYNVTGPAPAGGADEFHGKRIGRVGDIEQDGVALLQGGRVAGEDFGEFFVTRISHVAAATITTARGSLNEKMALGSFRPFQFRLAKWGWRARQDPRGDYVCRHRITFARTRTNAVD